MCSSIKEQNSHIDKNNILFITRLCGPSFSNISENGNKTFLDNLFKSSSSLFEDVTLNNQLEQTANYNFYPQNNVNNNEIKYTMFINKNNKNSLIISENPQKINGNFQEDKMKTLEFDKIYDENQSINLLYTENIQQSIKNLFQGKNSCIFLFGPKNSGKSYILRGGKSPSGEEKGLLTNCVQDILELINFSNSSNNNFDYIFNASFVLVYNNEIYDLLNKDNLNNIIKNKREISKKVISNVNQFDNLLKLSIDNRILLSDYLKENDLKRKSHFILSMYLERTYKNKSSIDLNNNNYSQIDLIELASSDYAFIDIIDNDENNILSNIKKNFNSIYEKILSLSKKSENTDQTKIDLFLEDLLKNKSNIIFINCVIPWEYPLSYSYNTSLFLNSLFNKINKNNNDNDGFITFDSPKKNYNKNVNYIDREINLFNKITKKKRKKSKDIGLNFNYSDEKLVYFFKNPSSNNDEKFNNSAIFFNKKNINVIPNESKNNNNDSAIKKNPVSQTKISHNCTSSKNLNVDKDLSHNREDNIVNLNIKKIVNESISINDENDNSCKIINDYNKNICTDNKIDNLEKKLDDSLPKRKPEIEETKSQNINQISSLQNEILNLEKQNKNLKNEIKKVSEENNELTTQINVEKSKNNELLEKNEKLSLKIFDMSKNFDNLEKVRKKMSEKIKNLEYEVKKLQEEKNNYEIKNNNLVTKYFEFKQRNEEEFSLVEEKINMVNNNVENLRDENKKLRLENEHLRLNSNLYLSQIDILKNKLFEQRKIKDIFFTKKKINENIIINENELNDSLNNNENKNYSNDNGLNKICQNKQTKNRPNNKTNSHNNIDINVHNINNINSNSVNKKFDLLNDLQKLTFQYRNQRTKKFNEN